jgi:prefoldin subunit 5
MHRESLATVEEESSLPIERRQRLKSFWTRIETDLNDAIRTLGMRLDTLQTWQTDINTLSAWLAEADVFVKSDHSSGGLDAGHALGQCQELLKELQLKRRALEALESTGTVLREQTAVKSVGDDIARALDTCDRNLLNIECVARALADSLTADTRRSQRIDADLTTLTELIVSIEQQIDQLRNPDSGRELQTAVKRLKQLRQDAESHRDTYEALQVRARL